MITLTTEQAQQIEEALEDIVRVFKFETGTPVEALATIRAARAQGQAEQDLDTCPGCGGVADNGHDREFPPNPYYCTKCSEQAEQEPVAWMHKCGGVCSAYDKEHMFGLDYFNIPLYAATQPVQEDHDGHWSDCSVHNEPAYRNGPCDCGGYPPKHWRCACGANLYIDSNGAPASKAEQVKQEDKDLVAQMNIDVGLKQKVYEALAEQAEQPVSQEYQDHLVNQSFDWAAMAVKHQFMEGYRIGLAEMREKCAKLVESGVLGHGECAAAIRAIKFEGDIGFRPVSEMIAEHKQDPKKAAAIEKAKMRKAEQEPVAWRVRGYNQFKTGNPAPWRYVDGVDKPSVNKPDCCDFEPLYAAPVRTKDLTDEEQLELARSSVGKSRHWLVAAVIAKFKEKNK